MGTPANHGLVAGQAQYSQQELARNLHDPEQDEEQGICASMPELSAYRQGARRLWAEESTQDDGQTGDPLQWKDHGLVVDHLEAGLLKGLSQGAGCEVNQMLGNQQWQPI